MVLPLFQKDSRTTQRGGGVTVSRLSATGAVDTLICVLLILLHHNEQPERTKRDEKLYSSHPLVRNQTKHDWGVVLSLCV